MLLQTPMALLTDRTLALDDIDGRFSRLLMGRAEDTQDWGARFDVVEGILARQLASAPTPPAGLHHAWRMLRDRPNQVDLARLPGEFGCSRRHLIAQFHKYFGMAPKAIARISRFHLALAAIRSAGRRGLSQDGEGEPYLDFPCAGAGRRITPTAIRWTDLALNCGYYDQSHFINEFRFFSGLSPLEFVERTRHE